MDNIKCERRIYNVKSNTHTHEFGQLILPLQGVLSIETDINQNPSSINNLFLYFYNFITTENLPNSVKYINGHFTEDIDLKKLADIEHYIDQTI